MVSDLPYHGYIDHLRTKNESQCIPLLKDLLNSLLQPPYDRCTVVLDIKEDNPIAILDKLQAILSIHDFTPERLILGVWNQEFLFKAKELFANRHQIMLIHEHWPPKSTSSLAIPEEALASDLIDIFSIDWDAVKKAPSQVIDRVHQAHKLIFVWVLNSTADIEMARTAGFNAVITDCPNLAKKS